jgi:hypothetical protein
MSKLLALPAEILLSIISETLPEGFEALCLSCKYLYNASPKLRERHNTLKRRYRKVFMQSAKLVVNLRDSEDESQESDTAEPFPSIPALLEGIANDPLVARYVEIADLKYDPVDRFQSEFQAWAEPRRNRIRSLIDESGYLEEAGVDKEQWYGDIQERIGTGFTPPHCLVLLLTLLPNVKQLALPTHYQTWQPGSTPESERIWHVYDTIVSRANAAIDASEPGRAGDVALSKLEKILPSTGTSYESHHGLYAVAPLISIRSVTEFYARSCIASAASSTGVPFNPRYDSLGVSLRRVELAGCAIRGREMRDFLRHCQQLRVLNFSGSGRYWNAGDFVAAISESPAAETIEELSLSIHGHYRRIVAGMSDLKALKKLKFLELDVRLFDGPPYSEFVKMREGKKDLNDAHFKSSTKAKVARLREVLPLSVENVHILSDNSASSVRTLQALFADPNETTEGLTCLQNLQLHLATMNLYVGLNEPRGNVSLDDPRWKDIIRRLHALGGWEEVENELPPRAGFTKTWNERFQLDGY